MKEIRMAAVDGTGYAHRLLLLLAQPDESAYPLATTAHDQAAWSPGDAREGAPRKRQEEAEGKNTNNAKETEGNGESVINDERRRASVATAGPTKEENGEGQVSNGVERKQVMMPVPEGDTIATLKHEEKHEGHHKDNTRLVMQKGSDKVEEDEGALGELPLLHYYSLGYDTKKAIAQQINQLVVRYIGLSLFLNICLF